MRRSATVRDLAIALALSLPLWVVFRHALCGPTIGFGGLMPDSLTCTTGELNPVGWTVVASPVIIVAAGRAAGLRSEAVWVAAGAVVVVAFLLSYGAGLVS